VLGTMMVFKSHLSKTIFGGEFKQFLPCVNEKYGRKKKKEGILSDKPVDINMKKKKGFYGSKREERKKNSLVETRLRFRSSLPLPLFFTLSNQPLLSW
jgi:hypothetical protein